MRLMTSVFVLFAIGFLGADEPKKDSSKIKGKWSVVSLSHGGQALPADVVKDFKCTFEDKTYNNVISGEVVARGRIRFRRFQISQDD